MLTKKRIKKCSVIAIVLAMFGGTLTQISYANNEDSSNIKSEVIINSNNQVKIDEKSEANSSTNDQVKTDEKSEVNPSTNDQVKTDEKSEVNPSTNDQVKTDEKNEVNSSTNDQVKTDEKSEVNSDTNNQVNEIIPQPKYFIQLYSSNPPWHYAGITLPRGGGPWYTVARTSLRNYPGTGVSYPSYDVFAYIAKENGTRLSGDAIHRSGEDKVGWHNVNMKGAKIKASFRSSTINIHTNHVNLRWSP